MTDEATEKRAEPNRARRFQVPVRTTAEVRQKLEEACAASGKSLTQEVEARIERSLEMQELLGDDRRMALMVRIADQVTRAEAATGKKWHADTATYWAVRRLIEHVLHDVRPLPSNWEEVSALQVEMIQLAERRDVLENLLLQCGVIRRSVNALLPQGWPGVIVELPQDQWANPKAPDSKLTDEDVSFLKDRLAEFREVTAEKDALTLRIGEMLKPHHEAKRIGEAIFATLTDEKLG
jgi:hypothetical protein